jgi:hypothetical protein
MTTTVISDGFGSICLYRVHFPDDCLWELGFETVLLHGKKRDGLKVKRAAVFHRQLHWDWVAVLIK